MRLFAILVLLAGCNGDPLPLTSPDGGARSDLAPPASSCEALTTQIDSWIDAHQSCQTAADCTAVFTECGLRGVCGEYVSGNGAELSSLVGAWRARSCGMPCGVDCANLGPPACVAGRCMARGPGAVGDPCGSDGECATGTCARGPAFPGGYCTVRDCNTALQDPCPQGSRCQPTDDGHAYCLKSCCALCDAVQCRSGYACCGNPQVGFSDAGCAPEASFLCMQEG